MISLSKLKTLEYRIYRKLREKLRNYLNSPNNKALRRKFEEETHELCEKATPARPIEYYFKIAKHAFDYCDTYPRNTNLIHE